MGGGGGGGGGGGMGDLASKKCILFISQQINTLILKLFNITGAIRDTF